MGRWRWFLFAVVVVFAIGGIWYLTQFRLNPMDPGVGCDPKNVIAAKKAVVRALAPRIRGGIGLAVLMGAILAYSSLYLQLWHARFRTLGGLLRWLLALVIGVIAARIWMQQAISWAQNRTRSCLEEALSDPSTARLVPFPFPQFHLSWANATHLQAAIAVLGGTLLGLLAYLVARKQFRV
jgi:hypothetical protein